MGICTDCICLGYCIKRTARLVSNKEIANSNFIRDVRKYAYSLSIPYPQWHEHVSDTYRDYAGWIAGPDGREVFLELDIFETDSIRFWFRDFCCTPLPDNATPYVKDVALERVRVLATILRASNPKTALMWGIRAANDN